MIKSNNLKSKPKSVGNNNILKVLNGDKLVWQVIKVGFEGSTKSSYIINISNTSAIKLGKIYTFTTSKPYNNYKLVVDGKEYNIKNGTTFTANYNCEIKISNLDYNYFDIKIYETDGNADIKIKKPEIKFNGFEIVTFGSVNFNGNYDNKLPLNVPLKLRIRNNKQTVNAKLDYRAEKRMYSGAVFMLKTEKVFTISTNGMLDIEIKQTSEWPEYIFE
nr:MAG TPA_asm: hypothetical protein [Caudoviricetes sp.]